MTSSNRFDPNQPKHWHECAEHFDDDSEDEFDDVDNDPEDPEISSALQGSSDESNDDDVIEKDSGDESDISYVETECFCDEEPPRRRAKREQLVEQPTAKIFTVRSGRQ
ncbi:unnamed protein product [Rotaria sp. Silwood2]|nr:unnamed protein product [Rotaria sp. Silwood2]CAF3117618.1 unnamed protein product [Rotaria sp. Silwood2]CAF4168112.1 unnamed protein product [Rotaria sp. Silwood2]CAF4381528.1 unnamed protein product [Rotaria sp. Silwood2]